MDAAEGSKSKKDNQVVFLNWKLAKPRMRFTACGVSAGEHRRSPKALRANANNSYSVFALLECDASSHRFCCWIIGNLFGIWNLDFGFRWTGIEISREN
jgi:hypothetical protein